MYIDVLEKCATFWTTLYSTSSVGAVNLRQI